MKRLALSLLALLLLAVPSSAKLADVYHSVRPLQANIMSIEGDTALRVICTATSINSDEQYWLTAAHCLEGQEAVFVAGEPTTVVFNNPLIDIAVVQTQTLKVKSLKIAKTPPGVGDKVKVVGHPLGYKRPVLFSGKVALVGYDGYTWYDMTVCGGNSGSSVVNAKDEVTGVLQVGWGRPCTPFSGGSPWKVFKLYVGGFFRK